MLNEQEMQFADPDWKPTGPLSTQPTGPLVTQATNTLANASMPVSTTGPGNGQAYDASQLANSPAYSQGYQGSWQGQQPPQSPYQQFSGHQSAVQQVSGTQRGRGRPGRWIWVVLIIICIALGSGIFRSANHSYSGYNNAGPQPAMPVQNKQMYGLKGATQLNINDLSGDITVQIANSADPSVAVTTDDGSQPRINYQGPSMVLTADGSGAITVIVPSNMALNLSAGTNNIEVDGFSGQLIAQTNSGQITLNGDNLSQGSSLNTNSGNINLGQPNSVSDTTITSSSGAIALDQTSLSGKVTVSTGGDGTISYNGPLDPQGKYQFTTESGAIGLTLPQDTAMQMKISQKGGSYNSDFPNTAGNSPRASVGITTNNGNITISKQ